MIPEIVPFAAQDGPIEKAISMLGIQDVVSIEDRRNTVAGSCHLQKDPEGKKRALH